MSQAMRDEDLGVIRSLREQVETKLRERLGPAPRMYYGGSYAKGTMIREAFDLDVVVYSPHTDTATLEQIFDRTHLALITAGYVVEPMTVALRLPYQSEFHVDVVPGRAQDSSFRYATLFKNVAPASTLQTSLKKHIEVVKSSGLAPIVRLLKVWRLRFGVPIPTFGLEIVAAAALAGVRRDDYAVALWTVFEFMARNLATMRLEDPANTNNALDLSEAQRAFAVAAAGTVLSARNWGEIVW